MSENLDTPLVEKECRPSATPPSRIVAVRPAAEIVTRQHLPSFVGISAATAGAKGISMNLVVIPPGGAAIPHFHRGFETAIYPYSRPSGDPLRPRVDTLRYQSGRRLPLHSGRPAAPANQSLPGRACSGHCHPQRSRRAGKRGPLSTRRRDLRHRGHQRSRKESADVEDLTHRQDTENTKFGFKNVFGSPQKTTKEEQ
jgi:uncharacterized RmlC-like cupin family protein